MSDQDKIMSDQVSRAVRVQGSGFRGQRSGGDEGEGVGGRGWRFLSITARGCAEANNVPNLLNKMYLGTLARGLGPLPRGERLGTSPRRRFAKALAFCV